jgi:GT2 family glycosyltransferase
VARREALETIGFLDEEYFFGPDDIDWTVRLRRQVGRVVLLPKLSLIHLGGVTTGAIYYAILPTVYSGCYTFFRRYHGAGAEWGARLILGIGLSAVLAAGWALAWAVGRSDRARVLMRARWNCVRFAFSRLPSPEVFAQLRQGA